MFFDNTLDNVLGVMIFQLILGGPTSKLAGLILGVAIYINNWQSFSVWISFMTIRFVIIIILLCTVIQMICCILPPRDKTNVTKEEYESFMGTVCCLMTYLIMRFITDLYLMSVVLDHYSNFSEIKAAAAVSMGGEGP